jgi:hypothetical protein
MPVGLRDRRRISQKLPSLQRRPKRLKQLSNRLFENRIVINTLPESSGVATTATTRGTLYGSEQNQGQQRAAITSRPGSDWSSSVTMTFSAAPGGSTRSKARSASGGGRGG